MIRIIVCLFLGMTVLGCSSKQVPDGFPKKLTRFKVTLLYEGKPVEKASIWLYPDNAKYHVNAITNANGVASMETTINVYSRPGAPTGKFRGTIVHRPKVPSDLTTEEWQKLKSEEEANAQWKKIAEEIAALPKIVPVSWGNVATSPLMITIPEKGGNVTIEITDSKTHQQ
ncbi:MAG: DUF4198 domain-containing protein [Planctomycetaceae bacterium]|nr:DUF4198 domain-containing protein [Planctomycetaceae bacterium]